ncbi:MAG: flagellar basal body rod protein FlgB [Bdellovibrionales bacterium]|nr:flagellar basal body rod protein FlgB [Bdellovibrionales bacterium]
MKIFDSTFSMIERAMDLRTRRHAVLASDIANSETPGYRAREVDFAGELNRMMTNGTQSEVAQTNPKHMDLSLNEASHIVFDDTGAVGGDGNNVDLDIALGKISDNGRRYSAATNYLNMKLRLIRFAASGGRGGV